MSLGVVVTAVKRQVSKRSGAEFARLTVEDFSGSSRFSCSPRTGQVLSDRIRTDYPPAGARRILQARSGSGKPDVHHRVVQRFEELRIAGQVMVAIQLSGGGKAEREPGTGETRWRRPQWRCCRK
jgi:DNA polymerase-3 subunit alpha